MNLNLNVKCSEEIHSRKVQTQPYKWIKSEYEAANADIRYHLNAKTCKPRIDWTAPYCQGDIFRLDKYIFIALETKPTLPQSQWNKMIPVRLPYKIHPQLNRTATTQVQRVNSKDTYCAVFTWLFETWLEACHCWPALWPAQGRTQIIKKHKRETQWSWYS